MERKEYLINHISTIKKIELSVHMFVLKMKVQWKFVFKKNPTKNRLGIMNFDLIRFIWIYKLIRKCFIVGNIYWDFYCIF